MQALLNTISPAYLGRALVMILVYAIFIHNHSVSKFSRPTTFHRYYMMAHDAEKQVHSKVSDKHAKEGSYA